MGSVDLWQRRMEIVDKAGKTRHVTFDYETAGSMITSLGVGPRDVVYVSTCHPMHLLALDTLTRELRDMGPIPRVGGGNFCAIARRGDLVIGAEYAQGQLWAYDTTKPWNPRARRRALGVSAEALYASAKAENGYLRYFASHDIAFFRGHRVGAQATFKLSAPADGSYHLHILPYASPAYGVVQFSLDGKEVGGPHVATAPHIEVGKMLVHGPFQLKKGEHHLTVRIVKAVRDRPMCGIVSAALSPKPLERLVDDSARNPAVLAQWSRDICRPRTALAHPDGRHVMMAGFAGYGLVGGGIGIYDLESRKPILLTADRDLLPGHSCITLKALPNGDLIGGTSVSAPGGGHATAKDGELFILDWKTKRLVFHFAPLPKDQHIISIEVMGNGLVYGLSSKSTFFVFDPAKRKLVHRENFDVFGRVPRHALHAGPDGNLYALMSGAILRIDPGSFRHQKLAVPPKPISAGGALVNGFLCWAAGSHVWSYDVPGLVTKGQNRK